MENVFDVVAIDETQRKTGKMVEVVSVTEQDILKAIDKYYGTGISIEDIVQRSMRQVDAGRITEADLAAGAPVVRLVDQIIIEGMNQDATDIHIEPEHNIMRIRYRIDGQLRQGLSLPKNLKPAVVARVKIMANLDIAETRLPQDGKINFNFGRRRVDLRVSTFPTVFGENVVLRILDKSKLVMGLEQLGFDEENLSLYREQILSPHGIILVTGPTGSGKTTTLYSAMSYINSLEKNIITLEDPVEYELPIIRQCQVNVKAGLTFAEGLRSILRQDPDVILVGEMRDGETADMAVRAALTGHLVFSTLHTNDAPSAIPRIIDMGVEPFLVASSLNVVIAQRLVRTNCTGCLEEYSPTADALRAASLNGTEGAIFKRGRGCDACGNTGFRGRIGLFEILEISPEIAKLIMGRVSSSEIYEKAKEQGFKNIMEDGISKALKGITTIEEVLKNVA
jgi:type IV pilus assembly protein PilB